MPFTPEESEEAKKQLLAQVEQMPSGNKEAIKNQISSLDDVGLESFLQQNNIKFEDGKLQQAGTTSESPTTEKPIFESIIRGELPSYKIAENDKAIAILELNPLSKGHSIILPKQKTTTEKIPKSVLSLAQKIAKKLKLKLKPEDIKIETFSFQDYLAINIIPIYKDTPLKKEKAEESDLKKLQNKLETKTRSSRKKTVKTSITSNLPEIKFRIPF